METWYVAKTKPAKERFVESCLSELWGVEVFLPVIRRPEGKKESWEPLFPTYLFCHVDRQSDAWPAIRWAPGLCYFLGAGEELSPVPDDLVTHLKQRVSWWNGGGFTPGFAPGERVVVTSGPFSSLEGIFQRYVPARQRCLVLLEFVNRTSNVELPVDVLRAVSPRGGLVLAN